MEVGRSEGEGKKNEKEMRGERVSELYESFVKSKGLWLGTDLIG
jgi:hypothetical protein